MSNDGRSRGLGRGLSALLGEPVRAEPQGHAAPALGPLTPAPATVTPFPQATPANAPPQSLRPAAYAPPTQPPAGRAGEEGVREIPLERIVANPNQPRRSFDESELEDLAQSIRTHGVIQPIAVRMAPSGDGRFEIIAGERRWRAAARAGLTAIPAIVRVADDTALLEMAIIENVQRSDLNAMDEAQGYQSLIDRFGRTQQELADIVGKSRPHIANTLRLLQLPSEIQVMVAGGRLSAGHARALLTAPDPLALAQTVIAGGLSVREVEKLAARAKESAAPKHLEGEKPAADQDLAALAEMLSKALGVPVSLSAKGQGAGEIRIAYKTAAELDAVCRRLSAG